MPASAPSRSSRIRTQMTVVLVVAVVAAVALFAWKFDAASAVLMGDPRPLVLNGVVVLLFALGVGQLFKGVRHYELQERELDDFERRRAGGESCAQIFAEGGGPSLLAERYRTIKTLFDRGGPIDHGALSAIMVAEESLHQSFPRFVNNVLILTGVFGTVSSLIFALVGASDVLETAVPGEGMGLMLLGMNTALTTTATAIVCYFFFTFFYHRFTDLQTWILGRVEHAVVMDIVPEFDFEADTVNHQAKALVEDVRVLVSELRQGLGSIDSAIARLDETARERKEQGDQVIARQDSQTAKLDDTLTGIAALRDVLARGFRLDR